MQATFPAPGTRDIIDPATSRPKASVSITVYNDAACTSVASDITTVRDGYLHTDGIVFTNDLGKVPHFTVERSTAPDVLYAKTAAGKVYALLAQAGDRLDANENRRYADELVAMAGGSGTYVQAVMLPSASGGDDATAINAQLAAGAGKLVRGIPGQTYLIGSTLIIPSGTTLDMTGCTIRSTFAGNMLNNAAVAAARSVHDGSMSATSTGLTSSAAAFVDPAERGAAVSVWGAGVNGGRLDTTIASIAGNVATLAAPSVGAVSTAAVSIGPRDSNITILGGLWDRQNNGPSAGSTDAHSLRFRRVDGLIVRGVRFTGTNGKYALNVGDADRVTIDGFYPVHSSDGVHINGPASHVDVRDVKGTTGDDLVAFTTQDFASYNDTQGDITDVRVASIHGEACGTSLVKLVAASTTRILRFEGDGIYGDTSGGSVIAVGDSSISATVLDFAAVTFRSVHAKSANYVVNIGSQTGMRDLTVRDVTWNADPTVVGNVVQNGSSSSLARLIVSGVKVTNSPTNVNVVSISGAITDLVISDISCVFSGAAGGRIVALQGSGTLARCVASNLAVSGGGVQQFWLTPAAGTGSLKVNNAHFSSITYVAQVAGSGGWDVTLDNITFSGTALVQMLNAGVATLRGGNVNLVSGAGVATSTWTGTIALKSAGFPVDLALVNSKAAGDQASNTNAASNPFIVGPVTYDGTNWIPAKGYAASGTAVLVAGTVTVANTHITAGSIIRLTTLAPGGAVGHCYVSARTAGTSFAITSTSGTDTSTVYWEVVTF